MYPLLTGVWKGPQWEVVCLTLNRLYLKVLLQRSELQCEVSAMTAQACKQRVTVVELEWHKTMTYLLVRHSRLWIGEISKMKYRNVTWHIFFSMVFMVPEHFMSQRSRPKHENFSPRGFFSERSSWSFWVFKLYKPVQIKNQINATVNQISV